MCLPAEPELICEVFARESFRAGEGFFESSAQLLAQLESEVGIAQQFTQAIVDDPSYEFFQLCRGKLSKVHIDRGYGGGCLKCNWEWAIY